MQIIISNIKMPVRHNSEDVTEAARKIVRSCCVSAKNFRIYKQAIDARRKNNIHYVYTVAAEVPDGTRLGENMRILDDGADFEPVKSALRSRPVVVGMGPCGLFAAWVLAKSGNPPLIIERGEDVDSRSRSVKDFWKSGILNPESNVQFGEGGAGTFSDGKLTTRISDPRQRFVLKTFAEMGAPEDILYRAKPHIGTDVLHRVIKNMRCSLIEAGAEVRFGTRLTALDIKGGAIRGIEVNGDEYIPCDNVVLAIGHSSRDTYEMLTKIGISAEPKPFAVGVRIEHEQKLINRMQYGELEGLPPADYRVAWNGRDRSCYSFCMCPGGTVVNASSETGMLAVNGMSEHSRGGRNANSALVVTVKASDFEDGILGGMEFQRRYERLAFELGGSDGSAPIQLAADFVADRRSIGLKNVIPTVTSGFKLAELKNCLPPFVTETLREGLCDYERRMCGFVSGGSVLTGIESRTSAPIRFLCTESGESISCRGLYPSGEGAGRAGGIVSAAVDGIRAASSVIEM